jgi:hypothetical protein
MSKFQSRDIRNVKKATKQNFKNSEVDEISNIVLKRIIEIINEIKKGNEQHSKRTQINI